MEIIAPSPCFEQMLVFGHHPPLIPLALFTFNKLKWQASFEVFGEMTKRFDSRGPSGKQTEKTLPLMK